MAAANFVEWLISIFSGGNDPEREKRRLLKQIGQEINRSKYKFYKTKGPVALPQLGRLYFEIYKIVFSAKKLLANADKSTALKSIVIDYFLTSEEKALQASLEEDQIRERAKKADGTMLATQMKDDLLLYFSYFTADKVKKINQAFNLIQRFFVFINFDYYFAIKKYYSALSENDLPSSPRFDQINAEYVADDVKDFLDVALILNKDDEWDAALDILRNYKGVDVVQRDVWIKVLNSLHQVVASNVLLYIAQHASGNPFYKPNVEYNTQRIVEPYLDQKKLQVEQAIATIMKERKDAKIDQLLKTIFGTTAISRTKNYTDKANLMFSRKDVNVGGFEHAVAINYLKAFLLDVFKKDVRELQELLIVRGKWSTNISSQQMSESYYEVLTLSDQLINFDDSLSEEGTTGQKLRRAMGRVIDRDASTLKGIRVVLEEINDMAEFLIRETGQNLITFGKVLKNALEDYKRPNHELVLNWKELDGLASNKLEEMMTDVYKKTYFFIQLLQLYVKPKKTINTPIPEHD